MGEGRQVGNIGLVLRHNAGWREVQGQWVEGTQSPIAQAERQNTVMADLTKQVSVTTSWTEITAPLGLEDGTTYLVDVDGVDTNAAVYSAETDDANAPGAAVIGHAIVPPISIAQSIAGFIPSRPASTFGCASPEAVRELSPRRQEVN